MLLSAARKSSSKSVGGSIIGNMNNYLTLANPWEADAEGLTGEKINICEVWMSLSLSLGLPL